MVDQFYIFISPYYKKLFFFNDLMNLTQSNCATIQLSSGTFLYRAVSKKMKKKRKYLRNPLEKIDLIANNEHLQWRSRHRAERMVRRIFDLGFGRREYFANTNEKVNGTTRTKI